MKKIYIVHGWTYSLDRWASLREWMRQNDLDSVMLKVPGLTSPSNEVWDLEKYVDWLNQSVPKSADPFVLVGHSNGGRIGMAFASKYPKRLKQLILIDSAGVYHDEFGIRFKRTTLGTAAKIGRRVTGSSRLRGGLYRLARAQDYHEAPPNMRQTMTKLQEADKSLRIDQVKVPTTIIWGRNDRLTPLADGMKINRLIGGSKLHVIDDARHAPFQTHSDRVGALIKEAIK